MGLAADFPKQTAIWRQRLIVVASVLIAAFFLLSTLGWFYSSVMVASGRVAGRASTVWSQLGPIDHLMRAGQVLLACVASVALVMQRRLALRAFTALLCLSLFAGFLIRGWSVSFLPWPLLVMCTAYVYWIGRLGLLGKA